MTEPDPLRDVLREWVPIDPPPELDRRVLLAYRQARTPVWQRVWRTRVSIPVPVLVVAAMIVAALLFLLRPGPSQAAPASANGANVVTELDRAGFQPLPNGEVRVVPVSGLERRK